MPVEDVFVLKPLRFTIQRWTQTWNIIQEERIFQYPLRNLQQSLHLCQHNDIDLLVILKFYFGEKTLAIETFSPLTRGKKGLHGTLVKKENCMY
ncbi:hypothetical protein CEXT_770871 [Caerostris extrusa]|uniref:Uncharacterized protein n=1 Tax=Caerostris extrusa TaxID=172846 RepID=A0AAV4P4M5_CAEEX|nr:hypothetical protein CEXT_770871 [Caerostris extrusa]